MIKRLLNEFQFFLEKLLLRGAHFQILLMAILIVFISITGSFYSRRGWNLFKGRKRL